VRGAALERPVLHRGSDGVGERGIDRLTLVERALEPLEHVARQALTLHREREDGRSKGVVRGLREVGCAERAPVGAPLSGRDVLLTDGCHVLRGASYWWRAAGTRDRPDCERTR